MYDYVRVCEHCYKEYTDTIDCSGSFDSSPREKCLGLKTEAGYKQKVPNLEATKVLAANMATEGNCNSEENRQNVPVQNQLVEQEQQVA